MPFLFLKKMENLFHTNLLLIKKYPDKVIVNHIIFIFLGPFPTLTSLISTGQAATVSVVAGTSFLSVALA